MGSYPKGRGVQFPPPLPRGIGEVWSSRLPVTQEVTGSNPVCPANQKKMSEQRFKILTMTLWLFAIGSCAVGDGLQEAGVKDWGIGISTFSLGLILYLLFIHEFFKPL